MGMADDAILREKSEPTRGISVNGTLKSEFGVSSDPNQNE